MTDSASSDAVAALDAADPLRALRDRFALPDGVIYLDGNSLGPPPKAAFDEVSHAMRQEWGDGLIRSWNAAGWFTLTDTLGDRVGRLIGAEPGETVVTDTTSINIYKALHAALALRPDRGVILAEADSFPTDLYMAEGVAKSRPGTTLRLAASHEPIDTLIDERTAVVLINHVDYRSGVLRDMAGLTGRAQAAGALVVWDLCHSVGALPIDLNAAKADFAVGCTYKYLNGGPGAPAFVFAARRHHDRLAQPLSGWWGHAQPFAMASTFQAAPGIRRMLCGTQPILSLRALEAALDVFDDVDLAALRTKSLALTDLFMDLLAPISREFGLRIVTPSDPALRGSHVSVAFGHGYEVVQALIDRGIIGDFRAPDIMRFGFTPLYLRYRDVLDAAKALADILRSGAWQEPRFAIRSLVT
ncbi:MAG: kynureninase [Reyranella sp.]|uniref:kynureninase n=1 Tax=Reyranella sp. TaxID=1929291 RepID=UPI001AD06BE1|nr:kynureninase [Reyranella sp.]MBN9088443.1 kynureninase [Reyranella sp.]